jgi:hypothetical protein
VVTKDAPEQPIICYNVLVATNPIRKGVFTEMVKRYNRKMNIFEKLHCGWFWVFQIFEEWCWTMTHDEQWEFFNFLQTDYVGYEEDEYYE